MVATTVHPSAWFQSTRPVGGATNLLRSWDFLLYSFNPRAPWGARLVDVYSLFPDPTFQSTRPVGGATKPRRSGAVWIAVSIHAPRGGRDGNGSAATAVEICFNPRAPWGARHSHRRNGQLEQRFQSTRPVGGATFQRREFVMAVSFNPRAPWGARPQSCRYSVMHQRFQSTRPVGGATAGLRARCLTWASFNPRAPWGARPTPAV